MRHAHHLIALSLGLALLPAKEVAARQSRQDLPLAPAQQSGVGVSPIYEGWYPNPDGTFSLSFGYLNRNRQEAVDIPVGPENAIVGGTASAGLPTHFAARRHYGVLTVTVPASFSLRDRVVWTLNLRGERYAIPGHLDPLYQIDALGAPASGDTPPILRLAADGPTAQGPHGLTAGPVVTRVGAPFPLPVWATDNEDEQVTVRWQKWAGPGGVDFGSAALRTEPGNPEVATTATFAAPGDYVLYVRAQTAGLATAGHEQCCWTNGWVKVTVTR